MIFLYKITVSWEVMLLSLKIHTKYLCSFMFDCEDTVNIYLVGWLRTDQEYSKACPSITW